MTGSKLSVSRATYLPEHAVKGMTVHVPHGVVGEGAAARRVGA